MNIKIKELKIAGVSFVVGMIAHFFIIANPLFNADGIFYNRSMGAGSILGRWLIEVFNRLANVVGYVAVIPMLNVVMSLLIISFASIFLIRLLHIKNDIHKVIISEALLISPCIVQTFFYGFTSHIYALSIFFTILSIYEYIEKERIITSIVCNIVALSLYQAYIPFMLCTYLVIYMQMLAENDINYVLKKILVSVVSFVLAFLSYFMINSIINSIYYKGYIFAIHGMGEDIIPAFKVSDILRDIIVAYKTTIDMFMRHNVFAHNTTMFIRVIYLLLILSSIILFISYIVVSISKKSLYNYEANSLRKKLVCMTILFILSPLAINFIYIMTNCGVGYIEDRLSYSFVYYLIIPIVLLDLLSSTRIVNKAKLFKTVYKVVTSFTIIVLLHNVWLCYGSYYNQYKVINASKSFALELATNIKMLPGYHSDMQVLFIGSPYEKNSHYNYGYYVDAEHNLYSNFDVEYENILSEYPMKQVFKEFTALDFKEPDGDFADNIAYSKGVREMPLYPKDGSVKNIDGIVVVKFKDLIR